jgi:signal transduction histidine kinase
MQNIIYNAIQAMPKGGELALFANLDNLKSNQVLLSITDSGIGIDPSEINRVFRPFYTTKNMGTGLGLSVAHRIVEAHGGSIQVCHNPCSHFLGENTMRTGSRGLKAMRGTTVHIMLPVTEGCDKPFEGKLIT